MNLEIKEHGNVCGVGRGSCQNSDRQGDKSHESSIAKESDLAC